MADEWLPLLMLLAILAVAAGAVLTIRRGAISFLFLNFRRDESPVEFWLALLIMSAGTLGVVYVLLA